MTSARIARAAGLIAFFALAYGPIVALALAAARFVVRSPAAAATMLPTARTLPILARSVGFAAAVSAAAMALGVLVVTALWRRRATRADRAIWAVLALAGVPPYVHALAWTSTMTAVSALGVAGAGRRIPFTGLPAAGWVSTLALLPLATALALVALEHVPRTLREAGQLERPDGAVLRRIVLPLAAPTLLMGAALLFLLTVLDYSVTSLYQVTLYALEIFVAFSEKNEAAAAALSAVPLMVVCALVVALMARLLPRAMQSPERGGMSRGWRPRWPIGLRRTQRLALAVLAAAVVVPFVSLTRLAAVSPAALETLAKTTDEAIYSLAVAVSASLVAIPPALAAALWLHGRARSSAAWFAAALPLAFPSSLIGIGLITAFNTPVMPLHGTSVMPVLAAVARFAPLIALLLFAQRSRLDPALLDAGRVFQAGPWHGFRRVVVPLMLPGLVAAAAVGFVLALGELGATLIVAPPGRSTLTMRIYTYLHFGASDSVAVLCLVLLVAALAAGAVAAAAVGAMWGDRGEAGGAGDIGDVGEAGA